MSDVSQYHFVTMAIPMYHTHTKFHCSANQFQSRRQSVVTLHHGLECAREKVAYIQVAIGTFHASFHSYTLCSYLLPELKVS